MMGAETSYNKLPCLCLLTRTKIGYCHPVFDASQLQQILDFEAELKFTKKEIAEKDESIIFL